MTSFDTEVLDSARRDLSAQLRGLLAAAVTTDAASLVLSEVAAEVAVLSDRLGHGRSALDYRDAYEGGARRTCNPFDSPYNPIAPDLRILEWRDGRFDIEVILGPQHEGPPGRTHGGVVAGLLDNVSGRATSTMGIFAMSVSLDVTFLAGTPYGEPVRVTSEVTGRDGRKLFVDATVTDAAGTVTARSRGLFVVVETPSRFTPDPAEFSPYG